MTTPRLDLRTTAQVIKQTSASFVSSFYTFLFLSFLLFSFRTVVENGTLLVASFIDRDPSLKSLLSRLDFAGKNVQSPENLGSPSTVNRRRRPFLHLRRVGALDDDFFSGDDEYDRSFFGIGRRAPINGSFVNLSNLFRGEGKLGFSDSEMKDGIRFTEIVGLGFSLSVDGYNDANGERNETVVAGRREEGDRTADTQFFIKGFGIGRRDAAALFFLVVSLSAAYGWVIIGFLVINSCVLGVVFVAVVNDHVGKYNSFVETIWAGSRLGIRRLSGFLLMRWAVRDAITQLVGLLFFGEIEDQYSFFKLLVRLKLMPFSVTCPWIRGFETEISRFLFTWILLDTFVAFVFAVDCWVAIMDARRSGREIVKEGCYLISTMLDQAIQITCFEAILCGSFMRWVLTQIFGQFLASVFQSVLEVYFMVAWLIFYFAVRCKNSNSNGRRFGPRDLEGYTNGLR